MNSINLIEKMVKASAREASAEANLNAMAQHWGWIYRGPQWRRAEGRLNAARVELNQAFADAAEAIAEERRIPLIEAEAVCARRLRQAADAEFDRRLIRATARLRRAIAQ